MSGSTIIDTAHQGDLLDAALDYHGRRLATCSSDRTIKIFDVAPAGSSVAVGSASSGAVAGAGSQTTLLETLRGHEGPVWQLSWAHPKFGTILASAGYDGKVIVWRETSSSAGTSGQWSKLTEHALHGASVNSVSWGPHELGAVLACASSDGKVSVLEFKDDGSWDTRLMTAHPLGSNAVSWAPATVPGSLISATGRGPAAGDNASGSAAVAGPIRKFVTGGCDNLAKIWRYDDATSAWVEDRTLEGHTDWVRDVAWAPNIGLPKQYIATGGQDRHVYIWTRLATDAENAPWKRTHLRNDKTPFPDVVWRVSWSESGNLLAVSCGDGKIYVYKEEATGWTEVSQVTQ
ncbi:GTPase-activating protein S13 [Savitreella phatthalungensis]